MDPGRRPPVQVPTPAALVGAALPHADPADPKTTKAGVAKRAASKLPNPNKATLKRFKNFVKKWCKKNIKPLDADHDFSFETWLSKTNYTSSRKEELRRVYARSADIKDPKYHMCKCFMKDETYVDYKHARGIYSRTDEWKCFLGPMIKAIEEEIYKLPQFIKHIPVHERPDYIMKYLFRPDATYSATDFTSFEASFVRELMQCTSFVLYKHMMRNTPLWKQMNFAMKVLAGTNKCLFKRFRFWVVATRMSGEMDTSLANGFSNLMAFLFLCHEMGIKDVKMVVEGDDGLASTPGNKFPTSEMFAELGFNIKLDIHQDIEQASFCGIIFHRDERVNVTNPLENLFTIGWLPERYAKAKLSTKMAILRCKAFSAAYQYPGCPMIDAYARHILKHTRKYHSAAVHAVHNLNVFNNYERETMIRAVKTEAHLPVRKCGMYTRIMVQNNYGISIHDQIKFENFLEERTSLESFRPADLLKYVPKSWTHYYEHYGVVPSERVDYPVLHFQQVSSFRKYIVNGSPLVGPDIDDVY